MKIYKIIPNDIEYVSTAETVISANNKKEILDLFIKEECLDDIDITLDMNKLPSNTEYNEYYSLRGGIKEIKEICNCDLEKYVVISQSIIYG